MCRRKQQKIISAKINKIKYRCKNSSILRSSNLRTGKIIYIYIYVQYPFDIFADSTEISEFVDSLELTKADVIVLGGQGNSLLQGMSTPKFKKHVPSGLPAGFSTFGAGKTKVYHALNIASYDPKYLDNFGVFVERIMGCINQTRARTV